MAAALLAGVLTWGAYAVLSPDRLTDPAEVTAALEPSPHLVGVDPVAVRRAVADGTPLPVCDGAVSPRRRPASDGARPTPAPPKAARPRQAPRPRGAASFELAIPSLDVRAARRPRRCREGRPDGAARRPRHRRLVPLRPGADLRARGQRHLGPCRLPRRGRTAGEAARARRRAPGSSSRSTVPGSSTSWSAWTSTPRPPSTSTRSSPASGPARLHLVSCGGEWNPQDPPLRGQRRRDRPPRLGRVTVSPIVRRVGSDAPPETSDAELMQRVADDDRDALAEAYQPLRRARAHHRAEVGRQPPRRRGHHPAGLRRPVAQPVARSTRAPARWPGGSPRSPAAGAPTTTRRAAGVTATSGPSRRPCRTSAVGAHPEDADRPGRARPRAAGPGRPPGHHHPDGDPRGSSPAGHRRRARTCPSARSRATSAAVSWTCATASRR